MHVYPLDYRLPRGMNGNYRFEAELTLDQAMKSHYVPCVFLSLKLMLSICSVLDISG